MTDHSFHENGFEKKRIAFLASILRGNHEATRRIYREISETVENAPELSEVDQKALNQILLIHKKFRHRISVTSEDDLYVPHGIIRKNLAETARRQVKEPLHVDFETWRSALNLPDNTLRTLLQNVTSFQITIGCSNFCRRCNEWALAGPRKHFTFEAVKTLTEKLFEAGNSEFALYCASDPLDWRDNDKTVVDIMGFMEERGYTSRYGLLTKIPRGTEKTVEKLLAMDADFAVSITEKNRSTAEKIEAAAGKKLQVQHDTVDLLIPAGLDEDFSTIKSSITDNYGVEITPEGAFLIIPTYTSALNPTGQCRIPVTPETDLFPVRKTGRTAMASEFFKPFSAVTPAGRAFMPGRLLSPQVENILLCNGSESCTPPGMMNLEEYFKSYGPHAVNARKKLLPAVEKKLKDRGLSPDDPLFRKQMHSYRASCTPEGAAEFKKYAFSFFLDAVSRYLRSNPDKREIVLHLRRGDRKRYGKDSAAGGTTFCSVDRSIRENEDSYHTFQSLVFTLLEDPDNNEILDFIQNTPATHDPDTDRFVRRPQGPDLAGGIVIKVQPDSP